MFSRKLCDTEQPLLLLETIATVDNALVIHYLYGYSTTLLLIFIFILLLPEEYNHLGDFLALRLLPGLHSGSLPWAITIAVIMLTAMAKKTPLIMLTPLAVIMAMIMLTPLKTKR